MPNRLLIKLCGLLLKTLVVLVFPLLSGCKDTESGDSKVHLVLACPAGIKQRPAYEAIVKNFMIEHPAIEVELRFIPGSYYDKLLMTIAGKRAPDLMWLGQSFSEFAARGVVMDISDRLVAEDMAAVPPQILDWYRYKGKRYGVPFGIDTQYIVYNKKLFDEAGIPYPQDTWTYGDFFAIATKLTKNEPDGVRRFGMLGLLDESAFGGEFLSRDGQKAMCNTPEMIEYLQTNLDLISKYRISLLGKNSSQNSLDGCIVLFRQERVAMMVMFTWDFPYLQERLIDMDWDIVNNPTIRRRGHWASSQAIVVSSSTKHPEEAWLLCREMFGRRFQKLMSFEMVPANLEVAKEIAEEHREKPANLEAWVKAMDSLYGNPRVPHLMELFQFWYDAQESVWTHRSTPTEAVARAESEINAAIAKIGRRED